MPVYYRLPFRLSCAWLILLLPKCKVWWALLIVLLFPLAMNKYKTYSLFTKVKPKMFVKLTGVQIKFTKETFNSSEAKTHATIKQSVSREILERMMINGSCCEKTYIKTFGIEGLLAID
jgi:hypothetical protein